MRNQAVIIISGIIIILSSEGISGQSPAKTDQSCNSFYISEPVFSGNIYFCESGKDHEKTILLVHGIGNDASGIWHKLIPQLTDRFHIISFDLPGFGQSEKENKLYSPENYTILLKWIFDNYIKTPMILIGHSMGGAVSLYYAGTYPETVQNLIIADAAGILHGAALAKSLTSIKFDETSKYNVIKKQVDSLNEFIDSSIEATSGFLPEDISIVLDTSFLRKIFFGSPKKVASAALINTDFSMQINNIRAPLLLIWGENDPVAPLRTGRMLDFNISRSHLYVMPGIGHNPMLEKPAKFNSLIVNYLSEGLTFFDNQGQPELKKHIILDKEDNVILNGVSGRVKIKDCRNVQISNLKSDKIIIINSVVKFDNLRIQSEKTGVTAFGSDISITGGSLECDTGLLLKNCNADLAGVRIEGRTAAILSAKDSVSTIIFSVSHIKSPYNNRHFHKVIKVGEDNPL